MTEMTKIKPTYLALQKVMIVKTRDKQWASLKLLNEQEKENGIRMHGRERNPVL